MSILDPRNVATEANKKVCAIGSILRPGCGDSHITEGLIEKPSRLPDADRDVSAECILVATHQLFGSGSRGIVSKVWSEKISVLVAKIVGQGAVAEDPHRRGYRPEQARNGSKICLKSLGDDDRLAASDLVNIVFEQSGANTARDELEFWFREVAHLLAFLHSHGCIGIGTDHNPTRLPAEIPCSLDHALQYGLLQYCQ